jgi:50S ribosomal protein L16 3-hydroxylase
LSVKDFMRRYWQRRPLLVRAALPELAPLSLARLLALAGREGVESRLVSRSPGRQWRLAHGPFARTELPSARDPGWTLLVQGVDLHDDATRGLLESFRFVPDARLDDIMISIASDGGGVGPHVDSYDVFLLQARGRRRWRIGRQTQSAFDDRMPLKILKDFQPTEKHVLDPGDLLYLPPGWAHDGVAIGGRCMTYSIGMRTPQRGTLAAEIAVRLGETYEDAVLYRDAGSAPSAKPAAIPRKLQQFAADAVRRLVARRAAIERALGEVLSEPKAHVWFERSRARRRAGAVTLDRRTRMLYDARQVYINGEAVDVRGRDAALLRRLADERSLTAHSVRGASRRVRSLLAEWHAAGWLTR